MGNLCKIGLIINPIAGMGGSVGLKGTDGKVVYEKALALGAVPKSGARTKLALTSLENEKGRFLLLTCLGGMGEDLAKELGFEYSIIQNSSGFSPGYQYTQFAATEMKRQGVDILVFAGGDGTARDIFSAIGDSVLTLGIPAGVKIQSGVFASHPFHAGTILKDFVNGKIKNSVEAEVVDIDEDLYRQEILTAKLYGYLKILAARKLIQNRKSGSAPNDYYYQKAIANDLIERLDDDWQYLVAPGTTTRTFLHELGIEGSLLGVDLIHQKKLVAKDLNEEQILGFIKNKATKLVIAPTGGQGFLFGRGNQQLSSQVLKMIGKDNIVVIATPEKITNLNRNPLLVDSGDIEVDNYLSGYYSVINGYHQYVVYKVMA